MKRLLLTLWVLAISCLSPSSTALAERWSEPVEVRQGLTPCVSYQIQLRRDWLVVQVKHQADWHTYAMDNKQRVEKRLKGEEPLGMELPTEIELGDGLTAVGRWHQTKPEDLSKPELLWFSWGFSGISTFAVRVKPTGKPTSVISIRGQACDAKTCLGVNVSIPLELAAAPRSDKKLDLSKLVKVAAE